MSDYARNRARDLSYDLVEHCIRSGVSAKDLRSILQQAWEDTAHQLAKDAAKEFAS